MTENARAYGHYSWPTGPLLPPDEQGDFLMTTSARQLAAPDSDSWSWITAAARSVPLHFSSGLPRVYRAACNY
jgi:hypothetical protein